MGEAISPNDVLAVHGTVSAAFPAESVPMSALQLIDSWSVPSAAAATVDIAGAVNLHGSIDQTFRLASVSKLLTAWAALVAVEEGSTTLDAVVTDSGATLRQLLAHAAGYSFDGPNPIAAPGRSRVYSNTGYELLATHVAECTDLPFATYVQEAIARPLGMSSFDPAGSPAKDFRCTARDLVKFAAELLTPTLLNQQTVADATTNQFPSLAGILPGIGKFSPNPWGLGPEIRGTKHPHWTGSLNSPQTFGHFGGSGTFLWVDPQAGLACIVLTNRDFGQWAMEQWPPLSDGVLSEHRYSP